MVEKKKSPVNETLKEPCGDEVLRYGLSKRRLEPTRCDQCLGKIKVSAGIMLRIARSETYVICGKCRGNPGHPIELPRKTS